MPRCDATFDESERPPLDRGLQRGVLEWVSWSTVQTQSRQPPALRAAPFLKGDFSSCCATFPNSQRPVPASSLSLPRPRLFQIAKRFQP